MKIESVCSFMSGIYSCQQLIVLRSHWNRLRFHYSWGWRSSLYLCLFRCKKWATDESDILGICSLNLHVSFDFIFVQNDTFHYIFWFLIIMRKQLSMINFELLIKLLSTFRPTNSWPFFNCMPCKQNRLVHYICRRWFKRSNI